MKRTTTAMLFLLMACTAAAAQGRRASSPGAPPAPRRAPSATTSSDEVEQLLARNILASGGVEFLKIKTRTTRGVIEMTGMDQKGTFETYFKDPHKSMLVANTPRGQIVQASDGSRLWLQTPWGAVSADVSGQELAARGARGKDGFKFRNSFSSASLKGKTTIDGREMVVLAGTLHGRAPMLWYFDAGTFLLRRVELARPAARGEMERLNAVSFDSYATVDGVRVPVLVRHIFTTFSFSLRVTEVKHNVRIDDRLFTSPEGK